MTDHAAIADHPGYDFAFLLDGNGGGAELTWKEINHWSAEQGRLWVLLDQTSEIARRWLMDKSAIGPVVCEALLAEETRPRSIAINGGLLVIIRGVNLHPEESPEDMVSIRLWIEEHRIIAVRVRHLQAVRDLHEKITASNGPQTTPDFLVQLSERLLERMRPVIDSLEERADDLEEAITNGGSPQDIRRELPRLRQQAIMLRRYLSPQRDAFVRLYSEMPPWFDATQRGRIREIADRTMRNVEDLDALRERASVVQDEVYNLISDRMNRTIYLLTLVATIVLPLSFLTGLLGVNVGGIPGANSPWGFTILSLGLLTLAVIEIVVFKKMKWL